MWLSHPPFSCRRSTDVRKLASRHGDGRGRTPAWVFGPVWTALYLSMAIAAWLVWRRAGWPGGARALGLFAVQLALNAAWSPLFFGLRSPAAGLVDIAALWLAIAATVFAFFRIAPVAGALLVPYWLWVTFATALNAAIWSLNR